MVAFSLLSYVLLLPGRAASKICFASFLLTSTFFAPLVARLAARIISLSYFLPPTVIVLPKLFCVLMRLRTPFFVAIFMAFMTLVFIAMAQMQVTRPTFDNPTRARLR